MNGTKDTKNMASHVINELRNKGTDSKKTRQKVLLPTLKQSQRYVVYAVLNMDSKNVDFLRVHNDIMQQCNAFLGVFEGGKAQLMAVKFNPTNMRGIIRVDNKYVDKLKVCFGLIKNINNMPVIVDCLYVSGMLNKAVTKMNVNKDDT